MTVLTSSDDVVDALVATFAPMATPEAIAALKATFDTWDYLPSVGQRVAARLDNFTDIMTTPADGGVDGQGTVYVLNSAGQLIPVKSYPALRAGLTKGDPGKSMIVGSGAPAPTLGYVDDSYYDSVAKRLYTKTGSGWGAGVSLLGADATIAIGDLTLSAHNTAPAVTNRGTGNQRIVDISLPAPLDGVNAGFAAPQVTTLAAGSPATVTIDGPANASIVHFGIPAGTAGPALVGRVSNGMVQFKPVGSPDSAFVDAFSVELIRGPAFNFDKKDLLANRPAANTVASGYTFLAIDTGDYYVAQSGAWQGPYVFKGDKGDLGPSTTWRASGGYLQAKAAGSDDSTYVNVLPLSDITGAAGNTIISPTPGRAPLSTDGVNGDFYFDRTAGKFYGPKVAGAWPASPVPLAAAFPAGPGYTAATAIALGDPFAKNPDGTASKVTGSGITAGAPNAQGSHFTSQYYSDTCALGGGKIARLFHSDLSTSPTVSLVIDTVTGGGVNTVTPGTPVVVADTATAGAAAGTNKSVVKKVIYDPATGFIFAFIWWNGNGYYATYSFSGTTLTQVHALAPAVGALYVPTDGNPVKAGFSIHLDPVNHKLVFIARSSSGNALYSCFFTIDSVTGAITQSASFNGTGTAVQTGRYFASTFCSSLGLNLVAWTTPAAANPSQVVCAFIDGSTTAPVLSALTAVNVNDAGGVENPWAVALAYDSVNAKALLAVQASNNLYAWTVGAASGAPALANKTVLETGTVGVGNNCWASAAFSAEQGRVGLAYVSGFGGVYQVKGLYLSLASGISTVGSFAPTDPTGVDYISIAYDSGQHRFVAVDTQGYYGVVSLATAITNAGSYAGIATSAAAIGGTFSSASPGEAVSAYAGLTPTATYYLAADGTFSSTATGYARLGVALDAAVLQTPSQATVTDVWAGIDDQHAVTPKALTDNTAFVALPTTAGTLTFDTKFGRNRKVGLTANATLAALASPRDGQVHTLRILGGGFTLSLDASYDTRGLGAPSLSTNGAYDYADLQHDAERGKTVFRFFKGS